MIKALIFDMDGTIVDNMGVHTAVWLDVLAEFGVEITAAEFQATMAGMTSLETLRKLVNPEMTDTQAAEIARRKEEQYREQYRAAMQPVRGLLSLLQEARRAGMSLAVATAAGNDNIDFVMNGLALWDSFDAVVGADDVERGKPHPDLFLLAAERIGVPPEHCLVFEDALTGLEAARRAGMAAVAVTTSHNIDEVAHLPQVRQVIPDFTHVTVADFLGEAG
ncbi:MAG: beta-phosphoglucomutase [Anaerolineaceae bacterium]|nr:beta-phosphoglucomutase [Anaerolineaceae bacterium]